MPTKNPTPCASAPKKQEVVIRLNPATGLAHIRSSWPVWTERLVTRFGLPRQGVLSEPRGKVVEVIWATWQIPIGLVTLRRPSRPGARNLAGLAKARAVRRAGRDTTQA